MFNIFKVKTLISWIRMKPAYQNTYFYNHMMNGWKSDGKTVFITKKEFGVLLD